MLDKLNMGPIIVVMVEHSKQQPRKPGGNADSSAKSSREGLPGTRPLGESIVQSLPVGVIAFDVELKVIEANAQAARLVELGDYIDKSLAEGTDEKIWLGWTDQLRSPIATGETLLFDDVAYTRNGKTRLLRITCSPLNDVATAKNLGGAAIIEDVTEKVNVQRQLANAERLASVGRHASR
ncbi:MAG: PAS domain-containing protein, partial [Planctomycetota bacterium]